MWHQWRVTRAVVVGLLLAGSTSLAPPTPVQAGAAAAGQGLTGFVDMVLDEANGRIYVSQGSAGIALLDLAGERTGSVDGLANTGPLLLSDDATTLYAVLPQEKSIAIINTVTFGVTTHSIGGSSCIRDIASTAGLLWFADGCVGRSQNNLGALDLDSGQVTMVVQAEYFYPTGLAASPALPGRLFVANQTSMRAYDVTGGAAPSATLVAVGSLDDSESVAVSPDGTHVLGSQLEVRRSSDLQVVRRLEYGSVASAFAFRADGAIAVGNGDAGYFYVYDPGTKIPFDSRKAPDLVRPNGMAFGESLYYVTGSRANTTVNVTTPMRYSMVELATDRGRYEYLDRALLTVELDSPSSNRQVLVFAKPKGEARRLVATLTVDANGFATFSYTMRRTTEFSTTYAGDPETKPSSDEDAATVSASVTAKAVRYVRKEARVHLYRLGSKARFIFQVNPVYRKDELYVLLSARARGRWVAAGSTDYLRIPDDGRLRISVPSSPASAGRLLSVRAHFYSHPSADWKPKGPRLRFKFMRG